MACELTNNNPALLSFLKGMYGAQRGVKAYLFTAKNYPKALQHDPKSLKEQFKVDDKQYLNYEMAKKKVIAINKFNISNKVPVQASVKTDLNKDNKPVYSVQANYNIKTFVDRLNYPAYRLADNAANNEYILEDIANAKAWVSKNLRGVKVQEMEGLINGHGFGAFYDNTIILSNKAEEGTVYHEAFHAVFRQYFEATDRDLMITEAKASYDKPTTKNLSDLKGLYPSLTLEEIQNLYYEERLAEDFRSYMLGYPVTISKSNESLFAKLKEFIDKLKSILGGQRGILNTFDDIKQGKYANKEFNKSAADTKEIIDAVSFHFSQYIDEPKNSDHEFADVSSIEDLADLSKPRLYKFLRSAYGSSIMNMAEGMKAKAQTIKDEATKHDAITNKQLNIMADEVLAVLSSLNTLEAQNKLIQNSAKFLSNFGINLKFNVLNANVSVDDLSIRELSDNESDKVSREDVSIDKESVEVSVNDKMSPNIKYLIATLAKVDANGEMILNDFGLPQLSDYRQTINFIRYKLSNTESFDEQIEILKNEITRFPELSNLIEYLSREEPATNIQLARKVRRLKVQFRQDFSKNYLGYSLLKIGEGDGDNINAYFIDPTDTSLSNKLMSNWKTDGVLESRNPGNNVVTNSTGPVTINMAEFRKEFNKKDNIYNLASKLGMNLHPEYSANDINKVSELFSFMNDTYTNDHEIINRLYNDESKLRNDIMEIEIRLSKDLYDHMHFGPDGKPRYSMTEFSFLSQLINKFNKGDIEVVPEKHSVIFKRFKNIDLKINEGMSLDQIGKQGDKTSKLSYTDRILQSIKLAIDKKEHQIFSTSDKTLDYTVKLPDSIASYGEFQKTNPNIYAEGIVDAPSIKTEIINYVIDEIVEVYNEKENNINADIKYLGINNKDLSLAKPFIKGINTTVLDSIMRDKQGWSRNQISDVLIKGGINDRIDEYFSELSERYLELLLDNGVITQEGINFNTFNLTSSLNINTLNKTELLNLLKTFSINDYIVKRDIIELAMGSPKQFKNFIDFFKRASGPIGTKYFAESSDSINDFLNQYYPREDLKSANGKIKTYVISDQPVKVSKDEYDYISSILGPKVANAYNNIEDADGQGYISLDEYREFLVRVGEWTSRHDKIYDKLIGGQQLSLNEKASLNPLKAQYYGPATKDGKTFMTFQKYSLVPVFPAKGLMGDLHDQLMDNKAGMLIAASGVKVGAPLDSQSNEFKAFETDDETKITTMNDLVTAPSYEIDYKHLGIQVKTGFKIKNKTPIGTQQRKIVMLNMMSKGKPVPMSFVESKDGITTGIGTKSNDATSTVISELNEMHNTKTEVDLQTLLDNLGFIENNDGTYSPTTATAIKGELLRQINLQDTPQNVIDQIEGLTLDDEAEFIDSLRYPLDALLSKTKLQSILLSLIKNNAIKPDVLGGQKYQVSDKFATDTKLKFYRKGKFGEVLPAQLKIPLPKHLIELAESFGGLDKFNAYLKEYFSDDNNRYKPSIVDHKILSGIAYRIPTQDKSSMEVYEVVEYLEPALGDRVVVPTGWTTKNGSDFDIDKLFMFYTAVEYVQREITDSDTARSKIKVIKPELSFEDFRTFLSEEMDEYGYPFLGISERNRLNELGDIELKQLMKVLNKYSLYSNKGEMGSLYSKIVSGELSQADYRFFERIKKGLMDYNESKKDFYSNNENYNYFIKDIKVVDTTIQTSDAIQNRIIELETMILTSPESFGDLITPLDSTKIKTLTDQLIYITQGNTITHNKGKIQFPDWGLYQKTKDANSESLHSVYEWDQNLKVREENWLGKQGVGIAANNSTGNSLFQQAGVEIDPSDLSRLNFEGMEDHYEISKIKNIEGSNISDILKEFVSMYVDVGKNPERPVELKAGLDNENVWMYLLRRGVPELQIGLLVNQPIILEYNKRLSIDKSYLKQASGREFKQNIIKDLVNQYKNDIQGPINQFDELFGVDKKYSKTPLNAFNLAKNINTTVTNESGKSKLAKEQLIVLADYIKYDALAQELATVTRMTNQDTTVPKSFADAKLQLMNLMEIADVNGDDIKFKQHLHLIGLDRVISDTLLKGFFKLNNATRKMYNDLFVSELPELDKVMSSVISPLIGRLPGDQITDIIDTFYNDFITFLVSQSKVNNNTTLQQKSKTLFGKDDSFVKYLANWYKQNKNSSFVKNNMFLNNLELITNDDQRLTDSLKLYANKLSSFEEDRVVEDLRNLLRLNSFSRKMDLVYFGILQSGLSNSHVSYLHVIPHEHYAKVAKDGIESMIEYSSAEGKVTKKLINVNVFNTFVDQFYRNNSHNGNLVPRIKTRASKRNRIMMAPDSKSFTLFADSPHAGRHYVKVVAPVVEIARAGQFNKAEVIRELKQNKKKTVDTYIYKVSDFKNGKYTYVLVNKLGDGIHHKEYYSDLVESTHVDNNRGSDNLSSSYRLSNDLMLGKETKEIKPC